MPSNNTCAYEGCTSVKRKDPNLSFHRFPKDEQICRTWIARSGSISLAKKSRAKIENERICCKHFSDSDFIAYGTKGKRILRHGAVPKASKNTELRDSELAKIAVSTPNLVGITLATLDRARSALTTPDVKKRFSQTHDLSSAAHVTPDSTETVSSTRCLTEITYPTLELKANAPSSPSPAATASPTPDPAEIASPTFDLAETAGIIPNPTEIAVASHDFADPAFATPVLILDVSTSNMVPKESCGPIVPVRRKCMNETPKERKLKKTIQYLRAEIKKKNQMIRRQDIAVKKLKETAAFAKAVYALNENQLAFLTMQINHAKKGPWSEDEKHFALSLYRKSPSAYNYLRENKQFALPCVTLIRLWINGLNSSPTIDSENLPN